MDAMEWNQRMQKIKVDEIIYKAAVKGDVSILDGRSTSVTIKDIWKSELSEESNILHVAAKHGQTDFISHVCTIDELHRLIYKRNFQEDTPLHVAARHGHADAATCLVAANAGDNPDYDIGERNIDRDTPLHVALKYGLINLAAQLSQSGPQAHSIQNNDGKTPLHLLIDCFPSNVKGAGQLTTSIQARALPMSQMFPKELEGILEHFLSSYKIAATYRDTKGCTPLLMAADMRLYRVLKIILAYCPESAGVYDRDQRTLLHHINFLQYEELQELLRIPEICALKNVKDSGGNTPAHLAAKKRDFMLLKVLYESFANFSIKNEEGVSVDELIEPQLSSLLKLEEATFRLKGEWMKMYLYDAAANKGDVTVFNKRGTIKDKKKGGQITYDDNYFLSRMPNGSTILHLAVRNGHSKFAQKTLEIFPNLIFSTDFRGNSAVHIIARVKNPEAEVMMRSCVECYKKIHNERNEYMRDSLYSSSLWKVKNVEGYTALHEAIRANNHNIVSDLLTIEPSLGLEARLDTYTDASELDEDGKVNLNNELSATPAYKKTKKLSKKRALKRNVSEEMGQELRNVAKDGDVRIFMQQTTDIERGAADENGSSYFLTRTPDGRNILHIALEHGKDDNSAFVKEALNRFPQLIHQTDSDGNTPLHVAAKWDCTATWQLRYHLEQCCVDEDEDFEIFKLFDVKNSLGNRAIHEAACAKNIEVMEALIKIDPEGASSVNYAGETSFHVLAKYGPERRHSQMLNVGNTLANYLSKNIDVVYMRDCDGLTPLLRAARCGWTSVALMILHQFPQSAQVRDPNGKTFLHLLSFTGVKLPEQFTDNVRMAKELFEFSEVDSLRLAQDNDGNTPLHHVLKTGNSTTAKLLAEKCFNSHRRSELYLINNQHEAAIDLIANQQQTPKEIVWMLEKEFPNLNTSSFPSSYRILKEEIKEPASSLSVIAGLLATITFAAAFQVPGGFNSDNGSPVLLDKVAFKAFLVSDAIAMCGSMLVLFSLLWVMSTGKIKDSFRVLEFSYMLMRLSFYATLVAFMTGVYVATARKTLWLAIFVCVLCSAVILTSSKTLLLLLSKPIRSVTHRIDEHALKLDQRQRGSKVTEIYQDIKDKLEKMGDKRRERLTHYE